MFKKVYKIFAKKKKKEMCHLDIRYNAGVTFLGGFNIYQFPKEKCHSH